uniref:Uncharacterized protein n=1 Tax=Rhizophora mucronata TaxID=61149 RepID=A0A2P2P1U9_RHIMU
MVIQTDQFRNSHTSAYSWDD